MSEILKRVQSEKNKALIAAAIRHENRLRFHSDTNIDNYVSNANITAYEGVNVFLAWVQSLLPAEKFNIFLSLFRYPVLTNDLTDSIYSELKRVFRGRDSSFNYSFQDLKLKDDWSWYMNELRVRNRLETEGYDCMKTAINSIIVVDLPKVQSGDFPEPYFYFLPIEQVLGFSYDKSTGRLKWIAFRQDDKRIAYIDEVQYAIVEDKNLTEVKEHQLGQTPAAFFWTDSLTALTPELKKAPLSKLLSRLDWVLFFETAKKHLDMYAAYPIYSGYAQDCEYNEPESGNYCKEGYLRTPEGGYIMYSGAIRKCPVCEANKPTGVGAYIQVPQPTGDNPDMRKPIDITTIDVNSLKYNVDEVKRLKDEIHVRASGVEYSGSREAMNKEQITAGFEGKQGIINSLKTNFENAEKWLTDTLCKARYGDAYMGCSINYGTEFYTYTITELYGQYKQGKEIGIGDAVMDGILEKLIEAETQNNPIEMQRIQIIKHLEPYKHMSKIEVSELFAKGILTDKAQLIIKLNLSSFILRFERENMNIVEFGSQIAFSEKINRINLKLQDYANEQIETSDGADQHRPSEGASGADNV